MHGKRCGEFDYVLAGGTAPDHAPPLTSSSSSSSSSSCVRFFLLYSAKIVYFFMYNLFAERGAVEFEDAGFVGA